MTDAPETTSAERLKRTRTVKPQGELTQLETKLDALKASRATLQPKHQELTDKLGKLDKDIAETQIAMQEAFAKKMATIG
jgi:predicted  nucleic acid-binding Zn-ribbon protein